MLRNKKIIIGLASLLLLVPSRMANAATTASCSATKVTASPSCSVEFTASKTSQSAITTANLNETKGLWISISNFDSSLQDAYYACENSYGSSLNVFPGLANQSATGYDWTFSKSGNEKCYIVFFSKGTSPASDWSNALSSCKTGYVVVSGGSSPVSDPIIPPSNNPDLPTGPDCASKTCQGNNCWNGTQYISGTKTQGCATGTATATPSSLTPPGSTEITWSTIGASKVEAACISGPIIVARGGWYLNNTDCENAGAVPDCTDKSYKFSFAANQTGTEICTFYPTNSSDGQPGTPYLVTIKAGGGSSTCGNSILDPGEECDFNPAFGPYPNQCPNNGMCDQSVCKCLVGNCTPDCSCAANACSGSTCDNGCGGKCNGSKSCTNNNPGTFTSSYTSLHQFTYGGSVGFKNQNNPHTSSVSGSGDEYTWRLMIFDKSGVDGDYKVDTPSKFRVYAPPGTKMVDLFSHDGQGKDVGFVFVARADQPPTTDPASIDYNTSGLESKGFSLEQLEQGDCVGRNSSGYLTFLTDNSYNSSPLTTGHWIYVATRSIGGNNIIDTQWAADVDKTIYTSWYDSMTSSNSWLPNGDPPETISDPDCASKTCQGNNCWNGTQYIPGTRTQGCATGTATATPSSLAPPGSTEITWNTTGASKVEAACISGPIIVARGGWYLNNTDCKNAGAVPDCTDKGYKFSFAANQTGTEVCTFYPTNSSDGQPGTPYSVTIKATDNSTTDTPPQSDNDCKRDDPGCAANTCQDVYCFDGCNYQKGAKSCTGRR